MPGIDSNTLLMLHMDGTDGATTFTDSSPYARTVTAVGNAQIDTAGKFAQGGLFDGTGDALTLPDSADFAFGNFTIDFWVKFNVIGGVMFYQQDDGSNSLYWQYYKDASNSILSFQVYTATTITTNRSVTWTPVTGQWYHIALVKNGSVITFYVDGVSVHSGAGGSIPNIASTARIGSNPAGARCLNGWLDEYRISNIARYTANFTPETVAYDVPPVAPPVDLGDVKNKHFADLAAMMDSDCHLYTRGTFNLTVPAGETWYCFNAWFCHNGDGKAFFHRKIGIHDAMPLPAGTNIRGVNADALFWYARPSLVQSDTRYEDGELLYYTRLAKLKTAVLKTATAYRAASSTAGGTASLDSLITKGVITHLSTHGGCWITLDGGAVPGVSPARNYIVNTLDEINDGHEIRFTSTVIQPYDRTMFQTVTLGLGNRSDTYGVAHTEETFGAVHYVDRGVDW